MKRLSLFAIFIFSCLIANAQEYSGVSKTHKIDSKVFESEREIRVFVPFSYTENNTQKYPSIYLFDGQFDAFFDMTSGTMDYMSQMGELNEYIIIGIKTTYRSREFTPMYADERTKKDWGDTEIGQAQLLEDHLEKEVFPLVENNYRVEPFKLAIGHSLGGTFVLNALLSRPDFFQAVIAISPNLSYDYEQIVTRFDNYFKSNASMKKFIYMSAGTIGSMENRFRSSAEKLDRVIKYHNPKELMYYYTVMDGENHSTTPLFTISKGFQEMAKIWTISEDKKKTLIDDASQPFVKDLKLFYNNLSEWANYKVLPSINEINSFGYDCLALDKTDEALKVFNWAIELYPDDANIYDSKAEALAKSGDMKQAKVFYKKAIDVLEKTKSNYDSENYEYYKDMFNKNLNALDKS
ncbi:alpha/beta hydrolase-fold protein [uncultured Psychroserpens sp.]|uniref:alpha/beta hydrolase-fold protein n=1 Tax=uncultured Psychroserpens sp. TaxID=255436 RepID=UPI00261A9441|nr:alpha/beta hydrolase-fold protein [uncultured Psychroserpens sp.]